MKRWLDAHAPVIARSLRRIRHAQRLRQAGEYVTADGFRVAGDVSLLVCRKRADERAAENGEAEVFDALCSEADVLADAGANIGYFSMRAARLGLKVLSVEPEEVNYRYLLQNLRRNRCHGVIALHSALGRTQGVATLHGLGEMASLNESWTGGKATHRRKVRVRTLDEILCTHVGPEERLVVKIDVEGWEEEVLRGAFRTLERRPAPMWLIEHGAPHGDTVVPGFANVFEILWSRNYDAFEVASGLSQFGRKELKQVINGNRCTALNFVFLLAGTWEHSPLKALLRAT
jgi:FkbM family methyltransferase